MRRIAALSVKVSDQNPVHRVRPASLPKAGPMARDRREEPVALRTKAAGLLDRAPGADLPESFGYSIKRRLLGPPMVNEQLRHQRLSNFIALGVLSPDGISSSAYGTEEMLI